MNFHSKADKWENAGEETEGVCRFYGVEKVYGRENRELLWQVLRMHDMGGKLELY